MSWSTDWAHDLFVNLRQGLPLALLTTIVTSLVIAFWKNVFAFAKRLLGFVESPKEPISHSFPEGEIAHCYAIKHSRSGFSIAAGWRGAILDKGMVQQELGSGRYRRRAVGAMVARSALSDTARVILWRENEFPVVISLADLFSADHQPMQLEMQCGFRFKSADLLHSCLEEITLPLEQIAAHISERVALPLRKWVSTLQGEDPYEHREKLPEWGETAKDLVETALSGSPFEIVRILDLHLFSPALDALYGQFGELAKDNASARTEVERNRVRGSLRQAMLAGRLEEMRDQSQFENAVRVIEQEKDLREKALRRELTQAELTELQEKVEVWKRKQELLLQVMGLEAGPAQSAGEAVIRGRNDLRLAVEAPDSPFSPQERQRILAVLQSFASKAVRPEEILAAIAKGADIPQAVFDPLERIRGPHTLHVGEGWRVFDGESLWQIRLTRIVTRRHGFLWRLESPAQAHFEVHASPDNRTFQQEVALQDSFRLELGASGIPLEYLGGTPSHISVRIPAVRQ
jgi:hypothetical protein